MLFSGVMGCGTMLTQEFTVWLRSLRRHFHRYPELRYEEKKTAFKIENTLRELGVSFQKGVGGTGVVASIAAREPGTVKALRADMDALPLQESTQLEYSSCHEGIMHACGHDGHMAIALGVARWLKENHWEDWGRGKVLIFFQPAEEGGAGARAMIEDGVLHHDAPEVIFAGHLHPELPTGHIGMSPSVSHAACDNFSLRVEGKGGHGAHPDLCRDPIVAACHFVSMLQTVVSRSVPPQESAVLSVGRIQGGTASNIIPHEVQMEGTLRTLSETVRRAALERLVRLVEGLEKSFEVRGELQILPGYPLVVNDSKVVEFVKACAERLPHGFTVHLEPPSMGSEDFAYFLQKVPGALIRLGCHDPGAGFSHGLHSPYFDFDETVLDLGVILFSNLLTRWSRV